MLVGALVILLHIGVVFLILHRSDPAPHAPGTPLITPVTLTQRPALAPPLPSLVMATVPTTMVDERYQVVFS